MENKYTPNEKLLAESLVNENRRWLTRIMALVLVSLCVVCGTVIYLHLNSMDRVYSVTESYAEAFKGISDKNADHVNELTQKYLDFLSMYDFEYTEIQSSVEMGDMDNSTFDNSINIGGG